MGRHHPLGRRVWSSAVASCLLVAGLPAVAWGTPDPPKVALDHSAERYTLDGQSSTKEVASAAGHACAISPDESGVVACFSSVAKSAEAAVAALREGGLPSGWYALPPGLKRAELIRDYQQLADEGARPGPSAQASRQRGVSRRASGKRAKARRPVARAADGTNCGRSRTAIWTAAGFNGTYGTQGYGGVDYWRNYSSTFDGHVTSFWNEADWWTARWHDYPNGAGAYYGGGSPCRYVQNLDNASMTDGGTANDRFTSWATW